MTIATDWLTSPTTQAGGNIKWKAAGSKIFLSLCVVFVALIHPLQHGLRNTSCDPYIAFPEGWKSLCALAHNSTVTAVTASLVEIFVHWSWRREKPPLPRGEDGRQNS